MARTINFVNTVIPAEEVDFYTLDRINDTLDHFMQYLGNYRGIDDGNVYGVFKDVDTTTRYCVKLR